MTAIHISMGRVFKVLATFPDTESGLRAANAHMESHRDVGVIATEDGLIKLSALADKGQKLRHLKCSCCGGDAGRFAQWPNRDTGYGICPRCVTWALDERQESPEEFRRNYGIAGIHHATTQTADAKDQP